MVYPSHNLQRFLVCDDGYPIYRELNQYVEHHLSRYFQARPQQQLSARLQCRASMKQYFVSIDSGLHGCEICCEYRPEMCIENQYVHKLPQENSNPDRVPRKPL